jgi:hypothetical protein
MSKKVEGNGGPNPFFIFFGLVAIIAIIAIAVFLALVAAKMIPIGVATLWLMK